MEVYTDPNADFEIERKADNSPLTIADKKAHEAIAEILKATPYPILSEEGKKLLQKNAKRGMNYGLLTRLTEQKSL